MASDLTNYSADTLYAVLEACPTAMIVADQRGRIVLSNTAASQLFGYSADQFRARLVEDLIPAAYREHHVGLRKGFESAPVRRRMSGPREVPALHSNGESFPTEIFLNPVRMPVGDCVLATIADLRERRKAQQETERRSRQIADAMPILVAVHDSEGNCEFATGRWREYCGAALDQLKGFGWLNWVHAEDRNAAHSGWQAAADSGEGALLEIRLRRHDGCYRWFALRASHIAASEDQLETYIITCVDIEAERALRESIRSVAAIVEGSQDAILSLSLDGVIQSWNPAAERLFGYSSSEAIGQPARMLVPSTHLTQHLALIERATQGLLIAPYDTVRLHRDGTAIEISASVSCVRDASGEIVAVSKVLRDITHRKRGERRMIELTNELKRSNADLEQFAYAASHDLKEPLRTISLHLQMIDVNSEESRFGSVSSHVASSLAAVRRLTTLVDGLLAYSRVNTDEVRITRTDLEDVLGAVLEDLNGLIRDSQAKITHDRLPGIVADPTQMEQLFQNLIANAIKFSGPAAPRISITSKEFDGFVEINVKDNGIGIDPRNHERIFGVFKRLHSAEKYPGAGIGLALCKRIVERHGGSIWVNSALGQGSTFSFTLRSRF